MGRYVGPFRFTHRSTNELTAGALLWQACVFLEDAKQANDRALEVPREMRLSLLRWDYPETERKRHDELDQDGSAAGSSARSLRSWDRSGEAVVTGQGPVPMPMPVGGRTGGERRRGDEEGEDLAEGCRSEDDQ